MFIKLTDMYGMKERVNTAYIARYCTVAVSIWHEDGKWATKDDGSLVMFMHGEGKVTYQESPEQIDRMIKNGGLNNA
jgi:hypothetical protein